jgi:hypothetical protein
MNQSPVHGQALKKKAGKKIKKKSSSRLIHGIIIISLRLTQTMPNSLYTAKKDMNGL